MIRNILFVLGGLIVIAALTLAAPYWLKTNRADFIVLQQGAPIADFAFETIDGKNHHLSDFKGNPIIIHFWATWCPPCIIELPELVAMARKNPDITLITISTDRSKTAMTKFLDKLDLPDNVLRVYDGDKTITETMFATYQLPETIILNNDLTYRDKIIGAYAEWEKYRP